MSATGRNNEGSERRADDAYMTPPWCVRRLFEAIDLPRGHWLEPAAGNGAIIAHVPPPPPGADKFGWVSRGWTAIELRQECSPALHALGVADVRCPADFLADPYLSGRSEPFEVAITNPPFSKAFEFYVRCRTVAKHTVLLTRLNFLGAEKRASYFRDDAPDVFVLPNRPSFTGGGTDATEYAWLHWPPQRRKWGGLRVLGSTSAEERKAGHTMRELGPTP